MSIALIKWVWTETDTRGSTRLVLLALADQANDDGYCWPSLATIAKKANLTRRYVIRIIGELENKGLLQVEKRMKGREYTSNMYRLVMNNSSPPSEQESTTPSEQENTGVVNGGSLKPSVNPKDKSSLTPTGEYYFEIYNRKRWANHKQREYFEEMEVEFGSDLLKQAIDWAAVKNISDLARIRKAAQTMNKGSGTQKELKPSQDGSINV